MYLELKIAFEIIKKIVVGKVKCVWEQLIYDNGTESENRVIILAQQSILVELSKHSTWYMDRTFQVVRKGFRQLYTIDIKVNERSIPVVYALLQKKNQEIYRELFSELLNYCSRQGLELSASLVVMDFETAVMNAVVEVFRENVRIRGCFFHLGQSTWRKVQELGLVSHYKYDPEFRLFVGKVDALAFLLEYDVGIGMRHLIEISPEEGQELLQYFDVTYVTGSFRHIPTDDTIRLQRIPPKFPPCIWNVHDPTINGESRTNNISEGWNSKIKKTIGYSHPSIC